MYTCNHSTWQMGAGRRRSGSLSATESLSRPRLPETVSKQQASKQASKNNRARAPLRSPFPVTFPPCPWSISPEVTASRVVQLQLEAAAAGFAEPPGRRSECGESPRAAARPPLGAGLGAAQPARALLPRPSSLRPRRTSPSSRSA